MEIVYRESIFSGNGMIAEPGSQNHEMQDSGFCCTRFCAQNSSSGRMQEEIAIVRKDKKRFLPLLYLADPSEEMIDKYLEAGDMYLLLRDGEVACEAVVTALDEERCELKNLATEERFQKMGCASRLLDYLFRLYSGYYSIYGEFYDEAASAFCGEPEPFNFRFMLVGTADAGTEFYERFGFTKSFRVENFFTDNYPEPIWDDGKLCVDIVYLIKDLKS